MQEGYATNPSSVPVDMATLRSVAGGRQHYQDELVNIFFFNAAECMSAMELHCHDTKDIRWNYATEELCAISDSLGAKELVKVCTYIKDHPAVSVEQRREQLSSIKAHIHRLRSFLRETRY